MMEFVLEALHQYSLVGKETVWDDGATYSDMIGAVLSSLGEDENEGPFD